MATSPCPVGCACHDNPYAACDVPGGCGREGCGRALQGDCPACRRRNPETGLVCEPCRAWFAPALAGIAERYNRLPAMLIPSTESVERVTGTPEPEAPLNVNAEDLLTRAARLGGVPVDSTPDTLVPAIQLITEPVEIRYLDGTTPAVRYELRTRRAHLTDQRGRLLYQAGRDQIGYLPVAQVLDAWARHWATERREHRPQPTVPTLVRWLADRLDWACDHYEPIGDFTASLRTVRGNMMAVLGEFDPPPAPRDGVQCKSCDKRGTLYDAGDGSGDTICANEDCRKVYSAKEYHDWVAHLAGFERSQRSPGEVAELLRRRDPAARP